MPLHGHDPPVVVGGFNAFDDSIWCASSDAQAGSKIPYALMVQRIDSDFRCAEGVGDSRAGVDVNVVNASRAVVTAVVVERSRNLGGDILNESSAQCDIQDLRSAADRQDWFSKLAGRADQRDLGPVARFIGYAALRGPGLSVKRRLDIFAPGQDKAVDS